jgi:probable HAF family extracellular repeat protein
MQNPAGRWLALLLGALAIAASTARSQVTVNSVTNLGTLGGTQSFATGINSSGQVVGESRTSGGAFRAFLYSGGVMSDLGVLSGGTSSRALAINDSGQIVGYSNIGSNHGFSYSSGTMTDLGTLGGPISFANDVNASGTIAGYAYTTSTVRHAATSNGTTWTDLGTLGGVNSFAQSINSTGQVAGYSGTPSSGPNHAFIYSGGSMTDIGTLIGPGLNSNAWGINNDGKVVGGYLDANSLYHAFLYSGGTITDLGSLAGGNTVAYAINNSGQIVGYSTVGGEFRTFLYSGGTMYDLKTLAASFLSDGVSTPGFLSFNTDSYFDINDSGQIVGLGQYYTGSSTVTRAYLISTTAVPEPGTYGALAGFAALGLALWRRRREGR